jgi:hypothetical protein
METEMSVGTWAEIWWVQGTRQRISSNIPAF